MIRSRQLLPCPEDCPSSIYSLMIECWNEVPSRRPQFPEINGRLCMWWKNTPGCSRFMNPCSTSTGPESGMSPKNFNERDEYNCNLDNASWSNSEPCVRENFTPTPSPNFGQSGSVNSRHMAQLSAQVHFSPNQKTTVQPKMQQVLPVYHEMQVTKPLQQRQQNLPHQSVMYSVGYQQQSPKTNPHQNLSQPLSSFGKSVPQDINVVQQNKYVSSPSSQAQVVVCLPSPNGKHSGGVETKISNI